MSLQRQHFLLSYFKTLSVGPAGIELTTSRVTARCSSHWATGPRYLFIYVSIFLVGVGERSISPRKLIHVTPAIFRRTGGAHSDRFVRMARLLFSSMAVAGTQLLDGLHFDFPTLRLIQNNSIKLRCTAPTKGRYGLPSVHRRYALLDGVIIG